MSKNCILSSVFKCVNLKNLNNLNLQRKIIFINRTDFIFALISRLSLVSLHMYMIKGNAPKGKLCLRKIKKINYLVI